MLYIQWLHSHTSFTYKYMYASLILGIDGPVTTYVAPPEPSVGGLLVNVGSEEEEIPQPRTKVSDTCKW